MLFAVFNVLAFVFLLFRNQPEEVGGDGTNQLASEKRFPVSIGIVMLLCSLICYLILICTNNTCLLRYAGSSRSRKFARADHPQLPPTFCSW
jgi:hypothetical protein